MPIFIGYANTLYFLLPIEIEKCIFLMNWENTFFFFVDDWKNTLLGLNAGAHSHFWLLSYPQIELEIKNILQFKDKCGCVYLWFFPINFIYRLYKFSLSTRNLYGVSQTITYSLI